MDAVCLSCPKQEQKRKRVPPKWTCTADHNPKADSQLLLCLARSAVVRRWILNRPIDWFWSRRSSTGAGYGAFLEQPQHSLHCRWPIEAAASPPAPAVPEEESSGGRWPLCLWQGRSWGGAVRFGQNQTVAVKIILKANVYSIVSIEIDFGRNLACLHNRCFSFAWKWLLTAEYSSSPCSALSFMNADSVMWSADFVVFAGNSWVNVWLGGGVVLRMIWPEVEASFHIRLSPKNCRNLFFASLWYFDSSTCLNDGFMCNSRDLNLAYQRAIIKYRVEQV